MSYVCGMDAFKELVAPLARKLGATDFQIAKWRQRGVPDAWRWRITRAAEEAAKEVPEEAFERVAPKRRAA